MISTVRTARRKTLVFLRVVVFALGSAALCACETPVTLGQLVDADTRCSPIHDTCPSGQCTLHEDSNDDACVEPGLVAVGESCTAIDTCTAHAQCSRIHMGRATFATSSLEPGRCLKVCARDAPDCDAGQACTPIAVDADTTRVDYGVCF